jgi:type IV secretion system protein VirB10
MEGEDNDILNEKLSPDDPSLDLVPQVRFSNNTIKGVFAGLGCIVLIGFAMSLSPNTNKRIKEEEEDLVLKAQLPNFLDITDKDWYKEPEEILNTISSGFSSIGNEASGYTVEDETESEYPVYDRSTPNREVQIKPKENTQNGESLVTRNSIGRSGVENVSFSDPSEVKNLAVNASSMFFSTELPSARYNSSDYNNNEKNNNEYDTLANSISANSESDYIKQNQQRQKSEWLETQQNSDFSNYLSTSYTEAVAGNMEIKAGTVVPITMKTGINSDLPGDIIAQVTANVYDTLSGRTLLIPKGSIVYGSYDSSIAFGQSRVLLAWDRLLRPDGVSLNLKGMQGVDLSGYSGMTDIVDNHYIDLMSAVGVGTVFDTGMDMVVSLISSINVFDDLADIFEDNTSSAESAVESIIENMANQSPTIIVRAGCRGYVQVNKDMVLPSYEEFYY